MKQSLRPLKSRPLLYIALLMGVLLLMFMLRTCSTPSSSPRDTHAGGDTLNIAIEISPVGISTQGDTLSGYYYDLVREIARRHNRQVRIEGFTHLASTLEALENGRYDIVIPDAPTNTDLRSRFLTTMPVLIDRQVLVQRRDSVSGKLPYENLMSILGDTIYLPRHSPFATRVSHLIGELGDTIYSVQHPTLGSEQLIIMVALGELPNAVVNRHAADLMALDYPLLDTSVEISFNQFQSWLVNPRDSILCDSLNTWLNEFMTTRDHQNLKRQYNL